MPDILAPSPLPPRRKKHTTQWLVEKFIGEVAPTLASSSIVVVTRALNSMRLSLAGKPPTREAMHHWLRRRLSVDRVSPATLAVERTYANRFFEWCINAGYMQTNPLRGIPKVPIKMGNKGEISEQEFARLLHAAQGLTEWHFFLKLAWATGARAIDLTNLRVGNIIHQWDSLDMSVNFEPVKTKRSGREVTLRLTGLGPACQDYFSGFDQDTPLTEFLFVNLQRLHARGDGSFQRAFNGVVKKAGIESHITFHSFRHTRARRMLTGPDKVTPLVAADVLGISNLATLRRYSPASMEEKARATQL